MRCLKGGWAEWVRGPMGSSGSGESDTPETG